MFPFLDRLLRHPKPRPEPGEVEIAPALLEVRPFTAPLLVGPNQDAVEYARYRLDAIKRHMESNEGTVTDRFFAEARIETFSLIARLHEFNAITPEEEHDALVRAHIRSIG